MTLNCLESLEKYVDASISTDVQSILSCFRTTQSSVTKRRNIVGKKRFEDWIVKTIKKYNSTSSPQPQRPGCRGGRCRGVSGTFDGACTLDYHFT